MFDLLLVVGGLGLLVLGGDLLVRGASQLALLARVTPAVVGLTVVAAGTSAPELVVSISAGLEGSADLAIGNVVGSNIFNVALILGIAALVRPLTVVGNTVKLEWPVMALTAFQLHLLARDGWLDALEGGFFLVAFGGFVAYSVRIARRDLAEEEAHEFESAVPPTPTEAPRSWAVAVGTTAAGIAILVMGARLLVDGAVAIATAMGVSERVIGLSLVAIGTSLPELFTSVVAAYRGQTDIAVTNVVGSNIFNVLLILGTTSMIVPLPVNPDIVRVDDWWMIGTTALLLPLMYTAMRIGRLEGGILLTAAAAYTWQLFST